MEIPFYFCFFLFLYVLSVNLFKKNKNQPPSGFSLPIIGHLYLFKQPLHRRLVDLSNKYGPILFLKFGSRPVIVVSSPAAAEECFTKNDIIFANRPKLIAGKHLGYDFTTLVWASYGHHWRNLRRIAVVELLASNRLQMLYNKRIDEVRSLVNRLFRDSKNCEFVTVDMKSLFFELTLNVLMRMIAGQRYYGENIEELAENLRFKEIVRETFELSGATNIGDLVPILNCIGCNKIEKKLEVLQRKRDRFMQDLIEEHKREKESDSGFSEMNKRKTKTMIDVLLGLQEDEPDYCTVD